MAPACLPSSRTDEIIASEPVDLPCAIVMSALSTTARNHPKSSRKYLAKCFFLDSPPKKTHHFHDVTR